MANIALTSPDFSFRGRNPRNAGVNLVVLCSDEMRGFEPENSVRLNILLKNTLIN